MQLDKFRELYKSFGIVTWPFKAIEQHVEALKKITNSRTIERIKFYIDETVKYCHQPIIPVENYNMIHYIVDSTTTDYFVIDFDRNTTCTVKLRAPATCTLCANIEECEHLRFILKRVFMQKYMRFSFQDKDIEWLLKCRVAMFQTISCDFCERYVFSQLCQVNRKFVAHRYCIEKCIQFKDNVKI